MNNIGKILKEARIKKGLTRANVGEMSGISATNIYRIECGQRFPRPQTLVRLAKPLGFGRLKLLELAGYISPVNKLTPSIYETAWNELYKLYGERLDQENLDVMDSVLKGVVADLEDRMKQLEN